MTGPIRITSCSTSRASKGGFYDTVNVSPPCNTLSRLLFTDGVGLCPVRRREYPLGFTWPAGHDAKR
eukprot:8334846-Heterocapsa_arctica.AAC.1